ncbi:MAG: O-antigen ligase family protein [Cohaesibacteraceae bacterium]|nr:O-antigen ligase family protein [Cohaesibacteraceae bacterium]
MTVTTRETVAPHRLIALIDRVHASQVTVAASLLLVAPFNPRIAIISLISLLIFSYGWHFFRTGIIGPSGGWPKPAAPFYWISALFVWGCISLFWTLDVVEGISRLAKFGGMIPLGYLLFVAPGLRRRPTGLSPFWLYLASAVLFTLFAIFIRPTLESGRVDVLTNRTIVEYCLFLFPLGAMLFTDHRTRFKSFILYCTMITLAVIVTFPTNSQSAVLVIPVGIIGILTACFIPRLSFKMLQACVVLLALCMPVIVLLLGMLPDEILQTEFMREGSAEHRIAIWNSFLELVNRAIIVGWGFSASLLFDPIILGLSSEELSNFVSAPHPHNAFLQVWIEMGVVGATVFCGFILSIIRLNRMSKMAMEPFNFASSLCILAVMSFSHGAFQTWWLATLLLLFFGLSNRSKSMAN